MTGGSDDASPPEATSVDVSHASRTPGQSFTVTAHVVDPSGVQTLSVVPIAANGRQNYFCGNYNGVLISGTETDGIWRFSCTVPELVIDGPYTVGVAGSDLLRNHGWETTATDTLTITGANDGSGPEILSLAATPDTARPTPATSSARSRPRTATPVRTTAPPRSPSSSASSHAVGSPAYRPVSCSATRSCSSARACRAAAYPAQNSARSSGGSRRRPSASRRLVAAVSR